MENEEIKEEVIEENNERKETKNAFLENLDYIIVFALVFILYIVLIATGLDKTYRYLTFGFIALSFGSFELKKLINSKDKKSLIDMILAVTWLILAILQFVSFFLAVYGNTNPGVSSSLN